MIRVEANWNGMEVSRELSEPELAKIVANFNPQQLTDFLHHQGVTLPEVLDMIQFNESGETNNLDAVPNDVMERLLTLGRQHQDSLPVPLDSPRIRHDIDAATLSGSHLAQQKIESLDKSAEGLSDGELERQLREIGLLQHASTLMR